MEVGITVSLPLFELMGNISHDASYRASHDSSPGLDSDTKNFISSAICRNNRFVKKILSNFFNAFCLSMHLSNAWPL